jgi:multiple antibiotic resistance protein
MAKGELRQFVEALLLAVGALLPIVNPLGAAPVFMAITGGSTPRARATTARAVAVNSAILLLASIFVGSYVLDFFGLSVAVVRVGGGLVVCAIAWELLHESGERAPDAKGPKIDIRARAFYPLTLPLTVGPGSITAAVTLGANQPHHAATTVMRDLGWIAGVVIVTALIFVCYRYAGRVLRLLGETGTSVVMRLNAFILLCIGVQIVWNGVSELLTEVWKDLPR